MGCGRRREGTAVVDLQCSGDQSGKRYRRQGCQRWQCRTKVVRRHAKFADMGRQAVLALGVADRVRAGRQLGEEKNDDEEEMAQRTHGVILVLSLIHISEPTRPY